MSFLRFWEDLSGWNKVGLCGVVAAVVILLILYAI